MTLRPGDHDFAHLLLINRNRAAERSRPLGPGRSGGAADERRHDRHAERRRRHSCGLRPCRTADQSVERGGVARAGAMCLFSRCRCSTCTATSACRRCRSSTGSAIALVPNPRDLADLLATVRRVKPTFFNGVPTLYNALLNHADVRSGKVDFKSIRVCFSGASALLAETKNRFESITGGRIVEGYSLTEAMMAPVRQSGEGTEQARIRGDAAARRAGADFRRRRGTHGAAAQRSRRDRLAAPQLMIGYWNQPDETALVLRDHPDENGSAPMAAHGRPRISRRGRIPLHRRPQERSDQDERLSGVAARDRGGARRCIRRSPKSASPACRIR